LEENRKIYEDLFAEVDLGEDKPFEVDYEGMDIDDSVPNELEIKGSLYKMRNGKAPGATNLSIDQIKSWYVNAFPKRGQPLESAIRCWKKFVDLVQYCFQGKIPSAFNYGILVIIPKDDVGGIRGIGLLETVHKLISQIINL